jgi:CheY-like chemotaxis protein
MAINLLQDYIKINDDLSNHYAKDLNLKSIIFIDDDYVNFIYFNELLVNTKLNIHRAISLSQALQQMTKFPEINLIVLSASLPENFNNLALRYLKEHFPFLSIITLMDTYNEQLETEFIKAGSDTCLNRHTNQEHFVELISEFLHQNKYSKQEQFQL